MNKADTIETLAEALVFSTEEVELTGEQCVICGEYHTEMLLLGDVEFIDMRVGDLLDWCARKAYKAGWREGTSRKFSVTGMMCPECKKTPDNKRE